MKCEWKRLEETNPEYVIALNKKMQELKRQELATKAKQEESKDFFERVYDSIKKFSEHHNEVCISLAREQDKELVKRLVKSKKFEDQRLVGELVVNGLFEKWSKE